MIGKPEKSLMDEDEAALIALACAPLHCSRQNACATLAINHIKRKKAAGQWPPAVKRSADNPAISPTSPPPTWESHLPPEWSDA